MKRFLALLLLAGCGSEAPEQVADDPAEAPPAIDVALENGTEVDLEALQARVDAAMKSVLQDAKGAQYRNIRPGLADSVCGEVSPRRRGGGHVGFRPFFVAGDGTALVARSPTLSFDDPSDSFPDLYIRWCASEEELKRLGPQLDRAIADAAGPDGILGEIDEIPEPDPGSQVPAQDKQPPGPPGEKMGSGDSFFDSVRKPRQPAKSDK